MAARVLAWSWAVMIMARSGFFPLVTAQSHQNMLKTRGERANLPHDPNTTSDCTYWVDVLGSTSCQDVMDEWDLTLDMMTRWNPSLSIGTGNTCQGWRYYVSYCIEAYHEPDTMTTTTTTKMASTKTTSMPTSSPSAAGPSSSATWMERGCYIDSNPPTLAEQVLAPSGESGMTVNACQAACWTRGYVFAGVEAAKSCYCGNSIRNELAPDASSTCTMACSGNSTQVCGGLNRIIIYEAAPVRTSTSATSTISATTSFAATISSSPTSIAVPKPTETWTPLGCYEDTAQPRTLLDQVQVPGGRSAMTVDACLTACNSTAPTVGRRYEFAGVENGEECWCGSTINNPSSNVAGCQMPCRGNSSQTCGSGAHIDMYQLQRLSPQWLPLGCYIDNSADNSLRTLAHRINMDSATVSRCQSACLAAGYSFAGLEQGNQCWCDSNVGGVGLPAPEGSSGCNSPCASNMTEMCGGKDRLSLYFLTLNAGSINLPKPSGPAPIQHSGSWALQGCWAEPSNGVRALPRVFRDGAAMTVERCMSVAAAFQYAGVENGEECWFGNAINSGSSNTGDLSLCRTPCRGSSDSEFCGGLGHLLIYKASSTGLAPSPPTAPSTVAGKPWVGCYEDSNLRTLAGRSTSSANMTLGTCASFCQQFNYAYFGAEYARECYCGNSIGSAAHKVDPSECDMACVGSDGTQLCGRDSRISLYGTAPKSSQPLIVGGLPWKGCFQNYSPPLLDGPSPQAVGMTLAVCAKTCSIGKYRYFAVEASNTCWCGNKIQDERFTADSSECNMPCDGFSGSFCGGINRLSLYGQ